MSRKMVFIGIACLVTLTGCMDTRECKQTCWPHPVKVFSQTLGGTSCGCVQDPATAASSVPAQKSPAGDGF